MSTRFELYGILLSATILSLFFISMHRCIFPRRHPIHHTTPEGIRRLLNHPSSPTDTFLRSRASANARLVGAFNLTNTFVSADPTVHSAFRGRSIALLQKAQRDWRGFNRVALQAVELGLPAQSTKFHTFVQITTLSAIIVGLLDPTADITALATTDLEPVADLITQIWLLSKKAGKIPAHLLPKLNDHLRGLLADEDAYPNPLDFVIPTWETMWRVVAVTVAHIHADPAAREAFRDLNENTEVSQFRATRLAGASPSVENYINEALRRDPPVRHITRHNVKPSRLTSFLPRSWAALLPPRVVSEIADIESAQRLPSWGPDPDVYDARRFLHEPARAGKLLAFGVGPFQCAASRWAPMAAAVIVGAILNRVDGVAHQIVPGAVIGGREGWEGWAIEKVNIGSAT